MGRPRVGFVFMAQTYGSVNTHVNKFFHIFLHQAGKVWFYGFEMELNPQILELIRKEVNRLGTKKSFADKVGIYPQGVGRWLTGESKEVKDKNTPGLARALGLSEIDLYKLAHGQEPTARTWAHGNRVRLSGWPLAPLQTHPPSRRASDPCSSLTADCSRLLGGRRASSVSFPSRKRTGARAV